MNFVIPKKKRAVEKVDIDLSTLEPKATIDDTPKDSEKYNTVKNIILNGVSDRQVHHFIHLEKVQLIKNPFLEYKYNHFKANLRGLGQSDAESYEFLLLGFDPDDLTYIADNGYAVGTSFYGDLGSTTRGIYLYRYADLVTPSLLYKDEVMRLMVFRTLRGKSCAVGLGSTELEPTLDCCSHVAAADNTPVSRKSRQQLYRQAAVYHYEYHKDMSVADVPSGVLPYAVVDLKFGISDKNQHFNISPTIGYVHEALYYFPVYEGNLTILSANFPRALLSTIFEDSNKPHGLDDSLVFTKLLQWTDAYDIRGVSQLMAHDTWGLIARQREVCVRNMNERAEKWKVRYVSHFVWTCNDARFTTLVNSMRVEQCAAIAYSIDASTYVAFPSGQFSSVLGLPWLQMPSLHVLVVHANPLFYADATDVTCFSDESTIVSKTPLGTAILDGDDVALCRTFDQQGAVYFNAGPSPDVGTETARPQLSVPQPTNDSPYEQSPSQNSNAQQNEMDPEQLVPLPAIALPSSAGKSCLRSKPPQVFVEQIPFIGKSLPPPPPAGIARNTTLHPLVPQRKTRIRWAEDVVDNENKCGKKLSNDRDEAVKAGLHGRTAAKDLPSQTNPVPANTAQKSRSTVSPEASKSKKDLFQGVFSSIRKGKDAESININEAAGSGNVSMVNETSKTLAMPKKVGGKNCIITSLPLPSFGRSIETNREPVSGIIGGPSNIQDVSTVCDMEIESGSDGTPTPPNAKSSPDGDDEVGFIDEQDEDYDAQFQCDPVDLQPDSSQGPASPTPAAKSIGPPATRIPVETECAQAETVSTEVSSLLKELIPNKQEIMTVPKLLASPEQSTEPDGPASPSSSSPPPKSVSEMPENIQRLLELLRSKEASSQNRDTDLRKQISVSASGPETSLDSSGRQRKSRFDQPPLELVGCPGFIPKPVPPASIGYVGTVPALGSSIKDTDLRSQPLKPATLAFSIKKAAAVRALDPPAPLVFGDDVDDEDSDQQQSERKDQDDRIKKWDRTINASMKIVNEEVPQVILPQSSATGPDKPDTTKLFHILSGARMLQSQRDKQVNDYVSISTSKATEPSSAAPVSSSSLRQVQTPSLVRESAVAASLPALSNLASTSVNNPVTTAPASQPSKISVTANAFGLSNDVIQQLLKRSSRPSEPQQIPVQSEVLSASAPSDAPASPDPEGPASPDAPASPDPEERGSNGSLPFSKRAQPEIPLDCWQPTEDKRSEPQKIISVRTPKKPKRPKDIDGIICKGNEDQVMDSWIKAVEQKSETSAASKRGNGRGRSRSFDDEEEEGEILSDGSEEESREAPKPITVIGASSNNFHSFFNKKNRSVEVTPRTAQPPTLIPGPAFSQNPGIGRGFSIEQNVGTFAQHRNYPNFPHNGPFGTNPAWNSSFPTLASPLVQGSPFQYGAPRQENSPITIIVPDFMMFNRAAMTRMNPSGFEAFCERLKVVQTQENRIVSLHIHERLLLYLREMTHSLAGSEAGSMFHMYYSIIIKYKDLGVVYFMEKHACDVGDVSAAQTANCFSELRKHYHPSAVLIYMSNMSPSSSTGNALSSIGVRVMPPTGVMRTFGLDPFRHSFHS